MAQSIAAAVPEPLLAAAIRWEAIASLILASAALMGSPGPATISVAAVASAYGVRRSLAYLLGVIAGTTVVLLGVATGVTAAVLALPALKAVLIAIAAAYILWLAYRIATAPPLADRNPAAGVPSLAGAMLLAIANPKAWVAIAAVFTTARLADSATADAVAKTAVLSLMIVVIMVGWLLTGASLASLLRDAKRARVVNVTLAAALVATTLLAVVR
jgi:threonine/homoserine/homoserine lactone efflux protein